MMTRGNENEDENEDGRDTQPILSQETVPYSDDGGNSSSEARFLLGDIALVHTGLKITGRRDEDNESVNVDQPQCWIFLDTRGENLIAPCRCRGTQKFVHRSCLDYRRAAKEGFAFAHCTECRAMFYLCANVPPDRWWSRLKF